MITKIYKTVKNKKGVKISNARVGIFAEKSSDFVQETQTLQIGCPTWIRTRTKGSKGPCATITPSDNRI